MRLSFANIAVCLLVLYFCEAIICAGIQELDNFRLKSVERFASRTQAKADRDNQARTQSRDLKPMSGNQGSQLKNE